MNSVNGEGIYGSRPWKIYGEHPDQEQVVKSGNFNEGKVKYSAQDIRFTTKGDTLYAFCLGAPTTTIEVKSLGKKSKYADKAVSSVSLLGSKEKLHWKQSSKALVINKPTKMPEGQVQVLGFRILFKK